MRGRGLPLLLLALVVGLAPPGPAAPAPGTGGPALTRMYPRGNHWAVGHLMGKKNTEESPYSHQGGNLKQQLLEYIRCQEAARNVFNLIAAKAILGHQSPPQQSLSSRQSTWGSEENRHHLKDMADSLLRILNLKKGSPS
ncbi:gastrin-releasing peptide isoform X2 [Erinaceus europaeus]|uniref:Gastrin-releasing peptide n=1 Tax=Erinaceus europaeus TaxID=9365 RepID=A0A1S3A474_ERIEU|nr:gastrin-releasing peptide isoform X2 [Erinaceus europaeus]